MSRRAEGKEGRAFVGDMTDERSVEMASKLASEAFVFTVGSVLIWAEYERGQRAAAAKSKKEADAEAAEQERMRLEREVSVVCFVVVFCCCFKGESAARAHNKHAKPSSEQKKLAP